MVVIGKLSSSPNRYRGTDVEWKIDYFFSLSETDDAFYCSPEFSFGGETWYLWMHPNGRSFAHTTGYVSLGVLRKSTNGPPARLECYISLKTVKGGTDNEKQYTKDIQEVEYFIPRSELSTRRSELVPRGVLTVVWNIKGMASARRTSNNPSANSECCHCKWFFDADIIDSHQRSSCMQRPAFNCSKCLEVIVWENCLQKHYCRKKSPRDGKCVENNSENAHVEEARIQTEGKNAGKCLEQNSEKARIQKEEKDDYNPVQKLKMTFAIAMIVVAVVTGCIFAYSKTPLSPSQPYGEGVMEVETAEKNKAGQLEIVGVQESNISNSNQTGAVETKESEGVMEVETAEKNKTGQLEISGVQESNISNSNETGAVETKESDTVNKIQISEVNKANYSLDVNGFNESETSEYDQESSTTKPSEGEKEIQISEVNKTGQSGVAGSDESEAPSSNQNCTMDAGVKKVSTADVKEADQSESDGSDVKEADQSESDGSDVKEADQSESDVSDISEASGSNQPDASETMKSDNNLLKGPEKQCVTFATAIIVIVIISACIYAYFKTLLSSSYPDEEERKAVSTEKVNNSKLVQSEVDPDESEAPGSNETVAIETEEPVSLINLPGDYGFVTDINHLLEEGKGVDVTFQLETPTGKTEFFAHQLILAVMSPYFADEFYGKERNKGHQVIHLKGVNPKTFDQMLRYCYGKMPCLKTTEEACSLFKVASNFKVTSLLNLCCNFFRHTKIELGNTFTILKISDEMEDGSLGDMCYKILEEKTREVIASYELCDVTPAMVHTILDLPKLSLNSENELINWIFDWTKANSEEKDSVCKSNREYLGKLLQRMNFLALTMEEFARLCKDNPEFFNSDERASIYQNIALPGSIELPNWYNKDLKCRLYTGSKE